MFLTRKPNYENMAKMEIGQKFRWSTQTLKRVRFRDENGSLCPKFYTYCLETDSCWCWGSLDDPNSSVNQNTVEVLSGY
jgi:hypothetical protein